CASPVIGNDASCAAGSLLPRTMSCNAASRTQGNAEAAEGAEFTTRLGLLRSLRTLRFRSLRIKNLPGEEFEDKGRSEQRAIPFLPPTPWPPAPRLTC